MIFFLLCFFYSIWYYLTFNVCLKPMALERCCGCWLTVLHNSARIVADTLGQRLPYCGPTTFLPFRASSPSLPVLTGAQRTVVSSTFLAHSSVTVINTSTDSVLCINNNIPVWLVGWCGGSAMTVFTAASFCCCLVVGVTNH